MKRVYLFNQSKYCRLNYKLLILFMFFSMCILSVCLREYYNLGDTYLRVF